MQGTGLKRAQPCLHTTCTPACRLAKLSKPSTTPTTPSLFLLRIGHAIGEDSMQLSGRLQPRRAFQAPSGSRPKSIAVPARSAGRHSMQQLSAVPPALQSSYVDLAHQLADAAAEVTRKYFRSPFDVETKADASPVTIADKEAETIMRSLLTQVVPQHGVFGEEHGLKEGSGAGAEFMWVLDPIDGTKSFITGKPLFGTLISLLHNGVPVVGIIDQPILQERWVGIAGQHTTLNGKKINTRMCRDPKLAYLYATTPHMFAGKTEIAFNRLRDSVKMPMYGCDCYAYGLLSMGLCDLVVEADLKPYDFMALVPVIKGAGGVITDWKGQELVWKPAPGATDLKSGWPGEVCAAGDPLLHQQAIKLLDWH